MMYNFTVQCPDCISLIDANDFFRSMIVAIQDLELEPSCRSLESGMTDLAFTAG